MKVLDAAKGTGALLRPAARLTGPSGQVISIDPSSGMLNEHLRVHVPLRKNPRARREHAYLLQGLVFCGNCGAHLTPKACSGTKQTNFYYQCTRNGHTNGAACSMRYVPAETLEQAILTELREIALKSDDLERIVRDANEHSNDSLKELADNRRRVEGELQAATDKAERLVDVFKEQGAAGLKIVGDELKKLEAERGRLERQLADIKQEMKLLETETMNAEVMVTSPKTIADILDGATPDELKSLLPMFVERLVFHEPDEKGQGRVQLSLFERPVRREEDAVGINRSGASRSASG